MYQSNFPNVDDLTKEQITNELDKCFTALNTSRITGDYTGFSSMKALNDAYTGYISELNYAMKRLVSEETMTQQELLSSDFTMTAAERRLHKVFYVLSPPLVAAGFLGVPVIGTSFLMFIFGSGDEESSSATSGWWSVVLFLLIIFFLIYGFFATVIRRRQTLEGMVVSTRREVSYRVDSIHELPRLKRLVMVLKRIARRPLLLLVVMPVNMLIIMAIWQLVVAKAYMTAYEATGDVDKARLSAIKLGVAINRTLIVTVVPVAIIIVITLMAAEILF